MSILTITGLAHRFEDKTLFDGVDLSVNNYEHCGIVGLNGAGKSTFMNIISGRVIHDSGEVKWLKGVSTGYLDQHAVIDRSLTVMEYLKGSFTALFDMNAEMERLYTEMGECGDMDRIEKLAHKADILLGNLNKANFFEIESDIKKVANGLGINVLGYDTLIAHLSGGQRAKLMLAKLLLENPEVMLLDEPTNFLDTEHVAWLADFLNSFKGAFLLISHDTGFLNKVCKFIISLENRMIRKYAGNYDQFLAQHESNARQYAESYERQQEEIKKLETYIAKNKARAATAGMARSRQHRLDKIDVLEKPLSQVKPELSFPYVLNAAREYLELKSLVVGYDKPLLPPIDLTVVNDARLWIRGTNGVGKSTLMKTIMGRIPALSGSVRFNINTKPNYLEQDFVFNGGGAYNAFTYMNNVYPRLSKQQIRTMLAATGLKAELALRDINLLSGGEQVRIKLCDIMNRPSNLLILDEPTNHLDVLAKEALLEALKAYEGAIILVTHEIAFANELCNDIWDA